MLATTQVGRNSASQDRGLGEGYVWLMALGGSLLGRLQLGHWEGSEILATGGGTGTGGGLSGRPDGNPGQGIDNLLVNDGGDNRLINDSGDVLKINNP